MFTKQYLIPQPEAFIAEKPLTAELKRIKEGNLSLGDLPLGKWRYLTADEVNALK